MNKPAITALTLAAGLLLGAAGVHAEDIDIFSGPSANGVPPNVMIILDNASAWDAAVSYDTTMCPAQVGGSGIVSGNNVGKDVGFEQCALYKAMEAIRNTPALLGKLNVGLMMFGSNQLGGTWGGSMQRPNSSPWDLPLMNDAGIAAFQAYIKSIDRQAVNANSSQVGGAMYEAYSFFTGRTSLASGNNYSSHLTLACQKSFIIYIGNALNNGKPQDQGQHGWSELSTAISDYSAPAALGTQINTAQTIGPYNRYDANSGDEWARFLYQTDLGGGNIPDKQNVTTYTISVTDGSNPDYVQSNTSMALVGGGKSFIVNTGDVSALVNALLQIFNEVAAVNSVFASVALPISSNTQGTYANQVFIGMFRPDAEAGQRWMGNLKQYKFGIDTTTNPLTIFLADKNGNRAIDAAGSGFISPNATSFWTSKDTTTLPDNINPLPGYWRNNPQGISDGFDLADGPIVEKGGVHQRIRMASLTTDYATSPTGPRNVYTCTGTCSGGSGTNSLSGYNFATTNSDLTDASFGITAPTNSISSLSRSGTTLTVSLAAAPSPALVNGQNVTIQGSAYPEINGNHLITLVNSTTFTYSINESPVTPAAGTYTASTVGAGSVPVVSLIRGGGANPGTLVTATTSAAHGFANGDTVTVSGASGARYNGSFTISGVTSNTFQYTIADAPAAATTGGVASIGVTSSNRVTFTSAQITRDTTHSDLTSIVTVTVASNLPAAYASGASVNVINVSPSQYNVTLATIIGGGGNNTGTNCPGGQRRRSFCYSITTAPASPDVGGTPMADRGAVVQIDGTPKISHAAACTGGSPSTTATATANTVTPHPFVTGNVVNIAGNPVGANEGAYVGTFTVTRVNNNAFSYTVSTSPPCAPTAAGVTAVTSTGGIDKDSLIEWVRGHDNVGDESSPGMGITIRPSVHGDVLHSRPAVVNYGGTTGIVVFYGSNDGTYRAVNGNQSGNIGSTPPGGEIWSFVAPEFFKKLPRAYLNSPIVKLFSTPTGIVPTPTPRDYFFDGSTGIYQNSTTGTVHIYMSARRGGRWIYALDVSDPADPKFMWKVGCPNMYNNTGCTSGFSELGQTWSAPKVAFVRGNTNPVLIFGAGYDVNEDLEPPAAATMGRGIFIVDAVNGALLWRAGPGGGSNTCTGNPCLLSDMTYAMAADVTLLDRDIPADGKIDRLYAADTGGNIWRVDLEPVGGNTPSHWQVTRFASLGGSGTTKRKFLFPPDVVATANFDAVMAGTGDREHPMYDQASRGIVNRFYMMKDTKTGKDAQASPAWTEIVDSTDGAVDTAPSSSIFFNATTTLYNIATASDRGFYISLQGSGEKFVNGPLTVGGLTYFGTNTPTVPNQNSCSNGLGTAKGYRVNFITGAADYTVFDGGGLPPSPVGGLVDIDVNGGTLTVPFLIGGGGGGTDAGNGGNGDIAPCSGPDCRSTIGGVRPPIPITPKRKRVYWYIEKHDN